MAFLIVVVLLFMLWIVFLMPKPEEPEAEERAIQEAQIAEEQKEKEEAAEEEDPEEDVILGEDYSMLLPDGFVIREETVTVTAKSGLKLRTAPDTGSDNVVTIVPYQDTLTRIAEDDVKGWSAVILPEYEGVLFCSSDYVE